MINGSAGAQHSPYKISRMLCLFGEFFVKALSVSMSSSKCDKTKKQEIVEIFIGNISHSVQHYKANKAKSVMGHATSYRQFTNIMSS